MLKALQDGSKNQMVMHDITNGTKVYMQEESIRLYSKELVHYEALADLIVENNGSEEEGTEKLVALIN